MLTVAEAAKRAKRDPETIRRWIRAGRLASWKVGSQHTIDPDDLADAIGHRVGHRVDAAQGIYGMTDSTPMPERGAVQNEWLPAIVGRIVRAVDPVRIILFGSRAGGEERDDRDYELLIVLAHVTDRRGSRINVRRSFADLPVPAEILVATVDEVEGRVPGHPSNDVYWALKEGRIVYARDTAS